MSQQSAFLAAVQQKATQLEGQDDLDLANQLHAAAHVIQASDVAHMSSSIAALTAGKIVKGTHIAEEAIRLETVKEILLDLATNPAQDISIRHLAQG